MRPDSVGSDDEEEALSPSSMMASARCARNGAAFSPLNAQEKNVAGIHIAPREATPGKNPVTEDISLEELQEQNQRRQMQRVEARLNSGKGGNTTAKQYRSAYTKWWTAFVAYCKWSVSESMKWVDAEGNVIADWRFRNVTAARLLFALRFCTCMPRRTKLN